MIGILLLGIVVAASPGAQSEQKRRYLELAEATLREPITHDELRAAILSPAGVESLRALFELSISSAFLSPETS